jgi:xanthine dehydrogenase accessory factor
MLVAANREFDTIGGGHLELCACSVARGMLAQRETGLAGQRRIERFPLGPTLGQCCGGVVWLAFERITPSAHDYFQVLRQRLQAGQESWRLVAFDSAAGQALLDRGGACIAGSEQGTSTPFEPEPACRLTHESGECWLIDPCLPFRSRLFLFGAGHVGMAIVHALSGVPCHITWVDEREDLFPNRLPGNVTLEATDMPEALVAAAPAGASFLVMTHSHALDQRLAVQILRRADTGWFGLIGSRTKRIQFERRLGQRGIPAARLAQMICPIGVPGITGKAPAVIAIAVAAQLLQVWERQHAVADETGALRVPARS